MVNKLDFGFNSGPFRPRSVGKALLLHVHCIVDERGCSRIEWTVLDWNEPATEFYEAAQ
jgi:hypothetical protein